MPSSKLKTKISAVFSALPDLPLISLSTVLCAALLGLAQALLSTNIEAALAFWALGVAIILPYFSLNLILKKRGGNLSRFFGFALLGVSAAAAVMGFSNLSLALLFIAPLAYFGNKKLFFISLFPFCLWILAVPNAEYLHYFLSYPLRIIGAQTSAAILSFLGFAAHATDSFISIDGRRIVITAACSGVEQLEAMLLIAWIIATQMRKSTVIRISYFLTIIPIIIFTNCLRLVVTLIGVHFYSDAFLSDGIHTALGIAMVLLSIFLFLSLSYFFPQTLDLNYLKKRGGK